MDDGARLPETIKRRQRRSFGPSLALIGLLVTVGVLAAASGGGSKDPGAASAPSTSTSGAPSGSSGSSSSGQSSQAEQLQLAQCMRSHGVPNFPDPPANGAYLNAIAAAGINTQSPTYQAALEACKKYSPAGNLTPAQSAAQDAKGLEYSQCMRAHGVPNFPDPGTGPTGGQAINLHGTSIDPSSPTYQAANSACQNIIPSGK